MNDTIASQIAAQLQRLADTMEQIMKTLAEMNTRQAIELRRERGQFGE